MPEPVKSPYVRGFRIAVDGMKLAFRSPEVGRAYLRASLVIFALGLLLASGSIWALWANTVPTPDAETWLRVILWAARVIGTLAAFVLGPLLAIFVVNIGFPFFNQEVFMAGMRVADPERARLLEGKQGMSMSRAIGLALFRFVKFLGLSALLFVIGFVPVIGTVIASVGGLLLAARTVSWELLDPYFEMLDIRHAEQRTVIKQHQRSLLGFGLPIALLFGIPLVGPLLFGLAQVAGAVFVARELPVDPREGPREGPATTAPLPTTGMART
jgi:CysZ protein